MTAGSGSGGMAFYSVCRSVALGTMDLRALQAVAGEP